MASLSRPPRISGKKPLPGFISFLVFILISHVPYLIPSFLSAANLSLNADYRLRALSYGNLGLTPDKSNSQDFLSHQAQISFLVKNIQLEKHPEGNERMDVGISLRAIGIAGSTQSVKDPFDRIASRYPNTSFLPFVQNAYLQIHNLRGSPWKATIGKQPILLGSGLILSDDGVGFTGILLERSFKRWDLRSKAFYFKPGAAQVGSEGDLDILGLSLELPTEGLWQFNALLEVDHSTPSFKAGTLVKNSVKEFLSLRYALTMTQFTFDGEAALQRGSADPVDPARGKVNFTGSALMAKGTWTQRLGKFGEGSARLVMGLGSGDDPSTPDKDEAFFPSMGKRFDGLERAGFGEFYGATLYDAIGSTIPTSNGLPQGASGVQVVGFGFTLPPYKNIRADIDYFLFKADQTLTGGRSLGNEWDIRLLYPIKEHFHVKASAAFFKGGSALNPGTTSKPSASRFLLEFYGKF